MIVPVLQEIRVRRQLSSVSFRFIGSIRITIVDLDGPACRSGRP
jgi:hypothetical protein